jgi:hypothetical protein
MAETKIAKAFRLASYNKATAAALESLFRRATGRKIEIEAAIERLNGFARGLGLEEEAVCRIAGDVEAEAQRSAPSGSIEDCLAESRQRLMKAASAAAS